MQICLKYQIAQLDWHLSKAINFDIFFKYILNDLLFKKNESTKTHNIDRNEVCNEKISNYSVIFDSDVTRRPR